MEYVVLVIALGVTCFAGVQLFYLMFLQAANRQQRQRIAELERKLIALQNALHEQAVSHDVPDETEEVWAELIDDNAGQ
jgi:Tfp pilus assembly protein PilN